MIPNEVMTRSDAGDIIDRATGTLVSLEAMKSRAAVMIGADFPLVFWRGKGRIVASDDVNISLLVRGTRVDLTWDRVGATWERLLWNHTLTVDELGGGADAVGLVSLFAFLDGKAVSVLDTDGLLVCTTVDGTPVHQFADMSRPTSWAPWRRKIHGD
ncbi:MAG: hypothetical protein GX624_10045 [Actinobacteria bacterium]|nr:hypothetical protein [Actinomycetota bacterium]